MDNQKEYRKSLLDKTENYAKQFTNLKFTIVSGYYVLSYKKSLEMGATPKVIDNEKDVLKFLNEIKNEIQDNINQVKTNLSR